MTTVKQLREFLAHLPGDAQVRVLEEYTSGWSSTTKWVDLELPELDRLWGSNTLSLWGDHMNTGAQQYLDLGTN